MEGNSPIMTLEENAKYLKIGKSTLYKMSMEGKTPAVRVEFGGNNKVIIRIPYNQELIKKVRTLSGRKWNSKGKYWEVPYDENIISKLQTLFGENLVYGEILRKKFIYEVKRPKKDKKLHIVLSREEVMKILKSPSNIKHKAILAPVYSAGLRVGEVVKLKPEDIDSNRKPSKWLFGGARKGRHISTRTVQTSFRQACTKAGVNKDVTVYFLESGVDLRYLQEILGHKSSKTTEIYTHVSKASLAKIENPLDRLMKEEGV